MRKRVLALLLSLSLTCVPALAAETETAVPEDETETAVTVPDSPAETETALPESDAETAVPESGAAPEVSDSAPAPDPEPAETDENAAIGTSGPAEPVNPFTDVKADSPFLPGILYAVAQGITNGTTSKTFSPYAICTHAQILTFLWRAWGSPAPGIENPFPNLKTNAYYYQAALWSYEKSLIDTSFDPYAYCTRLQAVTYLWKLAGAPTVDSPFPFTDVPDTPDARNAIAWASIEQSITNGTTDTTFSPDKRCTRAQIVTFIYRGRDLFRNQGMTSQ